MEIIKEFEEQWRMLTKALDNKLIKNMKKGMSTKEEVDNIIQSELVKWKINTEYRGAILSKIKRVNPNMGNKIQEELDKFHFQKDIVINNSIFFETITEILVILATYFVLKALGINGNLRIIVFIIVIISSMLALKVEYNHKMALNEKKIIILVNKELDQLGDKLVKIIKVK